MIFLGHHQQAPASQPPRQKKPLADDWWTMTIFDLVSRNCEAMRFMTLINQAVAVGNFSNRADREAKKRDLIRLVGKLIRMGRLARFNRKWLTMPRSDQKYKAYLALANERMDLPPPNI